MDIESQQQVSIPLIIMQTWKNKDIPERWKSSVESIHRLMVPRGWEWVLMTDEDNHSFVAEHFPDFLKTFDNFRYPIQRADAIRACFLYIYGGIYMDFDFEVQVPLDDLFTSKGGLYFVPSGNLSGMFTNAFMASEARHPFWLEYIEEMKAPSPWYGIGKHLHVMLTTGPMALTRALRKTRHSYVSLPSALVTPCSVCDLECKYMGDSYLRQLEGGSWNGLDSMAYNFFLCRWRDVVLIILILLIALIVILLTR